MGSWPDFAVLGVTDSWYLVAEKRGKPRNGTVSALESVTVPSRTQGQARGPVTVSQNHGHDQGIMNSKPGTRRHWEARAETEAKSSGDPETSQGAFSKAQRGAEGCSGLVKPPPSTDAPCDH